MMESRMTLGPGLVVLLAVTSPVGGQVALTPGMELHYQASGGARQAWVVELVESEVALGGRRGCHRVRFAPGGPQAMADVRLTCVAGDTLLSWSGADREWRPARPIGAHDSLDIPGPRGVTRFLTGASAVDTIAAEAVPIIVTTVLTLDRDGTVVRRLRERYAPSLGTATWGVFEQRDGEGWRVTVEFRLVAIERPE